MSTTNVNFKAQIRVGTQIVPLVTEIVVSGDSSTGVTKGFLFKLDRAPFEAPLSIYLGDVVAFIEKELAAGVGSLAKNTNMSFITSAIPSLTLANFSAGDQTVLDVLEFSINSSTSGTLFSINLDVVGSDPTMGLIELPSELASWLKIENLSLSFSSTT